VWMIAKARFPLLGSDLLIWVNLVPDYAPRVLQY